MPIIKSIPELEIVSGTNGSIINIDNIVEYRIIGTVTLSSNWELTLKQISGAAATPVEGMYCRFFYEATVTLGGNHITILGTQIPDEYASMKSTIEAYYDGSNWIVKFFVDDDEDDTITNDTIEAEAITKAKIEDINYGAIWSGDASKRPDEVRNATGADAILVNTSGGATEFKSFVSGDVTPSISGNTLNIGANKVTEAKIATSVFGNGLQGGGGSPGSIKPDTTNGTSIKATSDGIALDCDETSPGVSKYYGTDALGSKGWISSTTDSTILETTIPHASILTLNSVPIELIGSLGVGIGIWIEDIVVSMVNGSGAYATNTTLEFYSNGATVAQYEETRILLSSVNSATYGHKVLMTAATDTQIKGNAGLYVRVKTGNPTGGGALNTLYIKIKYRQITNVL